MTDEASYLLIALDPWKTWGHGTFHGFLLRPLYLLAGESVVGLRWIGYAALLGGAWRLAGAVRLNLGAGKEAVASLCAPVLMVASFTCYSAGMRTPCYNWMILLGAMLAWSGWLRCGTGRIGSLELGWGLTIALLGKWGAALILLLLFVILSLFSRGNSLGPSRADWSKALLAFAGTTAAFAIYAGAHGIRETIQAGVLIAQTTGSHGWFILPKYGWELFYYLYRMGRALVWLLPAILLFWWLGKKNPKVWPIEKIATILFSAGLLLAAARGWWRGGIEHFGKESVLAGCWLLGVAWTVWAVRGSAKAESGSRGSEGAGRSPVLWGLVATPFLCGIGTNTSIADYAGQGTVFFTAVGVLLFSSLPAQSASRVAGVALTGLCLIQASRVSSSLLGMYRLGSILEQREILNVGPEAGRLLVNSNTKREVESIHEILRGTVFFPRSPVVGVDSLCGWVYLAGAVSPGVPWFFRDQEQYLQQVLAHSDVEMLDTSWVWIRSSSQMQDPARWWPRRIPPPYWKKAGEVSLVTDRGPEKLLFFHQKTDN